MVGLSDLCGADGCTPDCSRLRRVLLDHWHRLESDSFNFVAFAWDRADRVCNLGMALARPATDACAVPCTMPAASGWRIAAAVTFVPDAESVEMLEETVRAVIAIEYPHDTWVLDEGDDRVVRGLL
jgi:hypothetical protein